MKKGGVGGRGVRGGGRGDVEGGLGAGASVRRRIAGHSTAPKGGSHMSGGVVSVWLMAGAGCGWGLGGARRRCMKAKALQTIVTLYMTSSCYNNTAVLYCTVQVRLNIWLDKADHHHHHHLQYP